MKKFTFLFAAMMACATMFAQEKPEITNDSLWTEFMAYFNEYYPTNSAEAETTTIKFPRGEQEITNAAVFWPGGVDSKANIMTNENSRYKWLGDFIQEVSTAQGKVIDGEVNWRFALQSFLNNTVKDAGWPTTADFTGAGEPAAWNELYYANMPAAPETPSAVENTTVAVKAQKIIRNGQVLMVRNGKTFNMMGVEVK